MSGDKTLAELDLCYHMGSLGNDEITDFSMHQKAKKISAKKLYQTMQSSRYTFPKQRNNQEFRYLSLSGAKPLSEWMLTYFQF